MTLEVIKAAAPTTGPEHTGKAEQGGKVASTLVSKGRTAAQQSCMDRALTESYVGRAAPLSCGPDTATSLSMEGRASNQRRWFSSLKI